MLFHPYSEDNRCAVYRPLAPTAAVAYEQNYLEERLREAGFKVEGWSRHHGAWTGRPDALSFQDIIVVEKASRLLMGSLTVAASQIMWLTSGSAANPVRL